MTKNLSITPISKMEAVRSIRATGAFKRSPFHGIAVKDVLSTYYSLPTASRVQKCYFALSKQPASKAGKAVRIKDQIIAAIEKLYAPQAHPEESFLTTEDFISPRNLLVPGLPDPAFQVSEPRRFFYPQKQDPFRAWGSEASACLMREEPNQIESSVSLQSGIIPKFIRGAIDKDADSMLHLKVEMSAEATQAIIDAIACETKMDKDVLTPSFLGCYIPLFTPIETSKSSILGVDKELNENYFAKTKGLYYADMPCDENTEGVFYLKIENNKLHELREKYLLPYNLGAHPFHMIVCLKRRSKRDTAQKELFRLNVSCHAA